MAGSGAGGGNGDGWARGLQAGGSLIRGAAGFQAGKANAKMARLEGEMALRRGVAEDDAVQLQARRAAGEAIAAMGENGGRLGTGSALSVLRDIELQSGLDSLRVKTQARADADSKRYQAKLAKRQGAFDLLGSLTDAAGTLFGKGG